MVSLPLTGFPGKASDPVWVYVTGWVLYLLTWVIVISAAVRQIMSQVDYNLSQVCHILIKSSQVTSWVNSEQESITEVLFVSFIRE
jgi:Na+/pantothenate symporter